MGAGKWDAAIWAIAGSRTPEVRRMLPVGHATMAARAAKRAADEDNGCWWTYDFPEAHPKVSGAIQRQVSQLMQDSSTNSGPGTFAGLRRLEAARDCRLNIDTQFMTIVAPQHMFAVKFEARGKQGGAIQIGLNIPIQSRRV